MKRERAVEIRRALAAERFKQRREKQRTSIDLAHQQVCEEILGGLITLADVDRWTARA
ncbi:MAG: hypothetical protein Q7R45_06100 [Sulfuricaulis sp.]|nr:hypothetical protein [Sulfuricaulis sp.]